MKNGKESPKTIESIYESIPLGARSHARSIGLHYDGEASINIDSLVKIIGEKTIRLVGTHMLTEQHRRHISWILEGDMLHINIL